MKPLAIAVTVALGCALSGCATTGDNEVKWEVSGKCSDAPGGTTCEIGGKISGSWGDEEPMLMADGGRGVQGGRPSFARRTMNSIILASTDVPDAANFVVDVDGSTIAYPASGQALLTLRDEATGVVQATSTFAWYRTGTQIRLVDPDAVNNWTINSSGSATALEYDLMPFGIPATHTQETVVVSSVYEGQVTASSYEPFCNVDPNMQYEYDPCMLQ